MHLSTQVMSMRSREGKIWSGEPTLSGVKAMSDMEIARRLEDICLGLAQLMEGGEVVESLTNTENVQRINGLVEDIHEALMEYQVCILSHTFSITSDLYVRPHYNRISTMRVVSLLWVIPPPPPHPMFPQTNQ